MEQRRLTGPWVPGTKGTGFTYPCQRIWNYFNLSQPNLIDVPDLPTLVKDLKLCSDVAPLVLKLHEMKNEKTSYLCFLMYEIWQILGISLVQWVERKPLFLKSVPITIRKIKLSKCDVCEKTFRLQISLVQHMRSVHLISKFSQTKEKYYKCRYCTYQTYR